MSRSAVPTSTRVGTAPRWASASRLVVLLQGEEVAPQRRQRGAPDERDAGHDRRRAPSRARRAAGSASGSTAAGRARPGAPGPRPASARRSSGSRTPVLARPWPRSPRTRPRAPGRRAPSAWSAAQAMIVMPPIEWPASTSGPVGATAVSTRCSTSPSSCTVGVRDSARRQPVAGLVERHDAHPVPRPEPLDDRQPARVGEGPAVGQHHRDALGRGAGGRCRGRPLHDVHVGAGASRTRCRTAPSGSRAAREVARRSGGA